MALKPRKSGGGARWNRSRYGGRSGSLRDGGRRRRDIAKGGGWRGAGDGNRWLERRTRVRDTLYLSRLSEARTRGDGLCECFFNKFVVYQTQCSGKKRRFPKRHFLDVVHEQLGVFLGEVVVEELDFRVHDRFMAEEKRSRCEETDEKKNGRYPPCSEGSEKFLRDVGDGKSGLDVP